MQVAAAYPDEQIVCTGGDKMLEAISQAKENGITFVDEPEMGDEM